MLGSRRLALKGASPASLGVREFGNTAPLDRTTMESAVWLFLPVAGSAVLAFETGIRTDPALDELR